MLTLSQLVAHVESANNPTLVRFEPNWKYTTRDIVARFHAAHKPGKMTDLTAKTLLSCSWGKYQIMGSVLYELGYTSELVYFASSEYHQDNWFNEYVRRKSIDYSLNEILTDKTKRNHFAHKYNGDKKVYAERLLNVYEHLKGK